MRNLISVLAASLVSLGAAQAAPVTVNFDNLNAGDFVSTQYSGVSFSAQRNGATQGLNSAMVFDSGNPTGFDFDLGGPFENPLESGAENYSPGNILIISEDNDSNDPDDAAQGGMIDIVFDTAVTFLSLNAFDINDSESLTINFFDMGGALLLSFSNNNMTVGDNEFFFLEFGLEAVKRMEVILSGSGAIDDLMFEVEEVPVPAALPLMLSGLAGFGFASRRRKNAA